MALILPCRFLVPKGYLAITFFPFIFLKSDLLKDDKILVNHEKIHLRQQLELLVIPFFVVYFAHFFYLRFKHNNWQVAYRRIIFEREAYQKDNDLDYLKDRPFWNFLNF